MENAVNMLANKLIIEGVNYINYTKDKAIEVAEKCCGCAILMHVITNKEKELLTALLCNDKTS